ncbi:colicin immunity domain-containing protein [Parvularcula sp. IMCC14364]|uniref:colicin immunity domain-containing protein n=1 Tax=Parvularcula sp. IMCC14364 TaxID=3067902 RepID=UPI002740E625|nr:colicin immunity domain-containing protein [Parvularcula sp. IMCC14364]
MSGTLYYYAKEFLDKNIDVDVFAETFITLRNIENRNSIPVVDRYNDIGGVVDSIFVACDAYSPNPDRDDWEIDAEQLKSEVKQLIESVAEPDYKSRPRM